MQRQLAGDIKDNEKAFYKYARNKRKIMETVSPLHNRERKMIMDDAEDTDVLTILQTLQKVSIIRWQAQIAAKTGKQIISLQWEKTD